MVRSWKRVTKALSIILILTFLIISTASAAGTWQTLNVVSGARIIYNGQDVTGYTQPFIYKDITYVPVRLMTEAFGKEVAWDEASFRVFINDKNSSTETALRNELTSSRIKVAELERQIEELTKKHTGVADLSGTQSRLNSNYGKYENVNFDYSLIGDTYHITVTVRVTSGDWTTISSTNQKTFLQDVCRTITRDFANATIDGTVKKGSTELADFEVNASGSYSMRNKTDAKDLDDIEDDLEDKFEDAGDDYFDDDDIRVSISISGDEDDLKIVINFDMRNSNDDFDELDDDDMDTFAEELYDEIKEEIVATDYEDADITIEIEDKSDEGIPYRYDDDDF